MPSETAIPWWYRPFSVLQTNLQEVDATLDVPTVLEALTGHGADTWLLNVGGIVSFYPSALPYQSSSPFLADRPDGDLVEAAVTAAHECNVRVLARLDLSKIPSSIAKLHADWLFVSPTGLPQIYNTLFSVCPSGDYYQEKAFEIIDEILDRYPVDGFFINWFGFSEVDYSRIEHGVCHCGNCREAYAVFAPGVDLPASSADEGYLLWRDFSAGVIENLTTRIAAHIRARRVDVALILGPTADIRYDEANTAFGREFWAYASAETASAHAAGPNNQPQMMNCVSFVDTPYRMGGVGEHHFRQYLVQAISRGANPSTYIMGAPGRIPYEHMSAARDVTQFFLTNRETYSALKPAAEIALVRRRAVWESEMQPTLARDEFRGVYTALTQGHIPFDVIDLSDLPEMAKRETLKRYRLLILPALGVLDSDAVGALDRFVERGGSVLLTGDSAVDESGAVQLRGAPAVMRQGIPQAGAELWSSYASPSNQAEAAEMVYSGPIVPVYGQHSSYIWRPSAERKGVVLASAPFGPPEKCYGHIPGKDPARASSSHAGGTVTMIPWTVGATFREFDTDEARDHLLSAVDTLVSPCIEFELPPQVDVAVATSGSSIVIHIINMTGERRRGFGPSVPVENGRIRMTGVAPDTTARLLVNSDPPRIELDGNCLIIDLPTLTDFEVIVVE